VVTYQSKYFPAFFSPSSGILSPFRMDSIAEIAEMLSIRK
jgi:pseudouridine-5'-phosphate glycosidase